jgi:hypothetical protein
MRASINEVLRLLEPLAGDARLEYRFFFWEQQGMLKRILLIGAVVGIALAHGVVLYKIDVGARSHSSDVKTVMVSRTRRALW